MTKICQWKRLFNIHISLPPFPPSPAIAPIQQPQTISPPDPIPRSLSMAQRQSGLISACIRARKWGVMDGTSAMDDLFDLTAGHFLPWQYQTEAQEVCSLQVRNLSGDDERAELKVDQASEGYELRFWPLDGWPLQAGFGNSEVDGS